MPQSLIEWQPGTRSHRNNQASQFASYSKIGMNLILFEVPPKLDHLSGVIEYSNADNLRVVHSVPITGLQSFEWLSSTKIVFSSHNGLGLTDFVNDIDWVHTNDNGANWTVSGIANNRNDLTQVACFSDKNSHDCNVTVFDVENTRNSGPVYKTNLEEPATSICWSANDSSSLLIGGCRGSIRLFDIRAGAMAQLAIMAHSSPINGTCSIKGIKADNNFSSHHVASFTDTIGEPIKIWDTRRLSSSKLSHAATISPYRNPANDQLISSVVCDAVWSPRRSNLLTVVTADLPHILFYSTGSSDTQDDLTTMSTSIYDVALPPECRPKKISYKDSSLLVSSGRGYFLASPTEQTALATTVGGHVTISVGETLLSGSAASCRKDLRSTERYSLEAADCMQVLSEELAVAELAEAERALKLLRLWTWVDRCDGVGADLSASLLSSLISNEGRDITLPLCFAPAVSLFSSSFRDSARRMCGWVPDITAADDEMLLEDIVEDLEQAGEFDRAAALALWQGNIILCINVLQRYLRHDVETTSSNVIGQDLEGAYANLVRLVLSSVTGFQMDLSGSSKDKASLTASWISMCQVIAKQLLSYGVNATYVYNKVGASYLAGVISFLQNIASGSYSLAVSVVLQIDHIAVEDRIAFACTYLSGQELSQYMLSLETRLVESGDMEGLVLTGLSSRGVKLIQKYVDSNEDLQTAALLAGHMGATDADEPSHWLLEYRLLLNRKQLFLDRANLDVQLGRRFRGRTFSLPTDSTPPIDRKGPLLRREMYLAHPFCEAPHVFLRCHFCSASLPADASQKQQQAAWQKKQGNILFSCSNCKKALPRCFVCLSHLGVINPQVEANRYLMQKRSVGVTESVSGHSSIALAHWFLFCQLCKHGGHAECVENWFDSRRSTCGVNGCTCVCQSNVLPACDF